jgi:hypothetical protein
MKLTALTTLRQLATVFVTMLLVSACGAADAERMNQAAEVILTQSANVTVESASVGGASATETPRPPGMVVTATPSLVYARCLTREAATMHVQPDASTALVIALAARDIFTAYGRTQDAAWILGWRNAEAYGWTPATNVGCTIPIPELMPTDPRVLLTPVAVAQVDTPTAPAMGSAAETPTPVPSPAPLTDTPPPPTESPTTVPTETATDTAIDTATATPVVLTTETAITVLPSTSTPVVQIQVVTVVVTVTVPVYIEVTAAPTALATPTAIAPATSAVTPTTAPVAVATQTDRGLACEVTPGTPVNFRLGPSRTDRLIGTLRPGTQFLALGRNDDGSWLYGEGPRSTSGWLIASSVQCNGDAAALPLVDR